MNFLILAGIVLLTFMKALGDEARHDYLITMRKDEILAIVRCVSKSRNVAVQSRFEQCNKLMAEQVIRNLARCNEEVIPAGMRQCNYYSVIYDNPDIQVKIYECIARNTKNLTHEDKKKLVAFENCARQLYAETCGGKGLQETKPKE